MLAHRIGGAHVNLITLIGAAPTKIREGSGRLTRSNQMAVIIIKVPIKHNQYPKSRRRLLAVAGGVCFGSHGSQETKPSNSKTQSIISLGAGSRSRRPVPQASAKRKEKPSMSAHRTWSAELIIAILGNSIFRLWRERK